MKFQINVVLKTGKTVESACLSKVVDLPFIPICGMELSLCAGTGVEHVHLSVHVDEVIYKEHSQTFIIWGKTDTSERIFEYNENIIGIAEKDPGWKVE